MFINFSGLWPFNPLSPNTDKLASSPHNITTWLSVQLMRQMEMIKKDKDILVFRLKR